VEFIDSVLCDVCSNVGRGVVLLRGRICLSCAQDDAELVKEIVRLAMPEMAVTLEAASAELAKIAGQSEG
jgi:hypothetical protein